MARPRKESLDYFPHDTDAANDEKIYAMRSLFGNDGYAFYFILLERIYRTSSAELDVSKPVLMASVVNQVGVTNERFDEMLISSFDVNLFDRESFDERKVITSDSVKRRFGEVERLREKWRNKKDGYSPALPSEFSTEKTGQEMEGKTPQSKVKQSKENISNTTDDVDRVFKAFCQIHNKIESHVVEQYRLIERKMQEGYTADMIISVMEERNKPSVNSIRYYDQPLMELKQNNKEAETQQRLADERKNNVIEFDLKPDPILNKAAGFND